MIHKKLLLILIAGIVFLGCGKETLPTSDTDITQDAIEVTTEAIEEIATETEQESQIMEFLDAHGNLHTMEINPVVKTHPYDWSKLSRQNFDVQYEDDNYYIRKGIDVSHHQGTVDWEKVKAAGYKFAIVRLVYRGYGESGSLNVDTTAMDNIQNAKAAGLDVGVYVFSQAINEAEALEEAELVLEQLDGMELELPIVFDPELIRDDEARTDNVTGEQFTKNTIVFCERIKEAGYEPMVYSNLIWEAELFDMEQIQQYPIWYADYEPIPQTPYRFEFWQYSEKGIVDGIDGYVDLNAQFCRVQ